MNIKFVYNGKTHKVSNKHQTLSDLRNAILAVYPEQLKEGFHLYVTILPQNDPLKVFDEQHFSRIQEIYKQMQWTSMKFVVKELSNPNLTQEDYNILNQSIIIKSNVQMPNVDDLYCVDQKQPEKVQEQPQQAEESTLVQEVIQQLNEDVKVQCDYNSEEFKQFVINIIDDRLVFHKLIQKQQETNQQQKQETNQQQKQQSSVQKPQHKMSLMYKQHNHIVMTQGQGQHWQIHVKNEGKVPWKIGYVKLIGVCGVYKDLMIDLQNDVEPNGVGLFSSMLIPPNQIIKDQTQEFKMAYFENHEQIFFGQKVCFVLTVQQNQQVKPQTITQKDADVKVQINQKQLERIRTFVDLTGTTEKEAIEFIKIFDPNTDIQEVIGNYLDQIK